MHYTLRQLVDLEEKRLERELKDIRENGLKSRYAVALAAEMDRPVIDHAREDYKRARNLLETEAGRKAWGPHLTALYASSVAKFEADGIWIRPEWEMNK